MGKKKTPEETKLNLINGLPVIEYIRTGKAVLEYVTPLFWDGKFENDVDQCYRISICTTAMDRLYDIQKTLTQNIADNIAYPNLEFVLLDYNSKDGLHNWIEKRMWEHVQSGLLSFYRTEEPKYYSMAHSRNIAFKLATGDIVLNVDADNYTTPGFVNYINQLAHQIPERGFFAKGKRMLRGRIGFYKNEFINMLGGYSEDLRGYGHDDHDIMQRAWGLGMRMMWFGGKFYGNTGTPKHQTTNFENKDWKWTEMINKMVSYAAISTGRFKANRKRVWGKADVVHNFGDIVEVR